jgi:hypothetical protein
MKQFLIISLSAMALAFCISCTNTEKCLQKQGYDNCEKLKAAFNVQNSDDALRYHAIKTKCGCKD